MPNDFQELEASLPIIRDLAIKPGPIGFFGQEALRFYSLAGTLLGTESFSLDENSSTDERYLTHIISRSLLENYFQVIYIFDDPAKEMDRYEELQSSFKREYYKLMNEPLLPRKNELEPADPLWANSPKGLDVRSMLSQVKNDYGDRLSYLYFAYRITSFDVHGKSLPVLFKDIFGKECGFPVIKTRYAIGLMANQYLAVLNDFRQRGIV